MSLAGPNVDGPGKIYVKARRNGCILIHVEHRGRSEDSSNCRMIRCAVWHIMLKYHTNVTIQQIKMIKTIKEGHKEGDMLEG